MAIATEKPARDARLFVDPIFERHKEYDRLLAGPHRRKVTRLGSPALTRHVAIWCPVQVEPPNHSRPDPAPAEPNARHWFQRVFRAGRPRPDDQGDAAQVPAGDRDDDAVPMGVDGSGDEPVPPGSDERDGPSDTGEVFDAKVGMDPRRLAEVVKIDKAILALWTALRSGNLVGVKPSSVTSNAEFVYAKDSYITLFGWTYTVAGVEVPAFETSDSYRAIQIRFDWHHLPITLTFEVHTEMLTISYLVDASGAISDDEIETYRKDRTFERVYSVLVGIETMNKDRRHEKNTLYHRAYGAIWRLLDHEVMLAAQAELQAIGQRFADFRGLILGAHPAPPPARGAAAIVSSIATGVRRLAGAARGGSRAAADAAPAFIRPFARPRTSNGTGLERESRCEIEGFDRIWPLLQCALPVGTELTASRFLTNRVFYATALGEQAVNPGSKRISPLCYVIYEDTLNEWQLGRLVHRLQRADVARVAAMMNFDALIGIDDKLHAVESRLETALTTEIKQASQQSYDDVERAMGEFRDAYEFESIEYRIDRSRYYASQFRAITAALRIRRVEGFQPYDEFVEQRIGPLYEYIDRLGRRITRVQTERDFLRGRLQRQAAMAEELEISKAQGTADLALGILVPYYLGHLFLSVFAIAEHSEMEHMVWIVMALLGTLWIVVRRWGPTITLRGRLAAAASALLVIVALGVLLLRADEHAAAADSQTPSKTAPAPAARR